MINFSKLWSLLRALLRWRPGQELRRPERPWTAAVLAVNIAWSRPTTPPYGALSLLSTPRMPCSSAPVQQLRLQGFDPPVSTLRTSRRSSFGTRERGLPRAMGCRAILHGVGTYKVTTVGCDSGPR